MGAHLIGFIVGYLSIVLANHTSVSLWYPLAIFTLPVMETVYTMIRKKRREKRGDKPFGPDKEHLHHFVLNYVTLKFPNIKNSILSNSLASVFILIPYFIVNLIGFIFRENDFVLIGLFLVSVFGYLYVYNILKKI